MPSSSKGKPATSAAIVEVNLTLVLSTFNCKFGIDTKAVVARAGAYNYKSKKHAPI
jgi:hypothetical protein